MRLSRLAIGITAITLSMTSFSDNQIEQGKQVYDHWCLACHGDYHRAPGTIALRTLYQGTDIPGKLEDRTDMTPEFIEFAVRNGRNVMPHFRKAEITDAEMDALSKYLTRNNK